MNAEVSSPRGSLVYGLGLAVLTFLLYFGVRHDEFLNYDDPLYVTANPAVQAGLGAQGARWAFTTFHAANWHPLTWLSHMLDVQLFQMDAGAHHLVNAGLHALAAGLLLLALCALTRRLGSSLVVAALFAAHPLRVQSVAWVSERKDLLASVFFFAMLLAYARHARRPSARTLAAVTVLFVLGSLAKPMLVTAPFVLLLLDVWPLGRAAGDARARRALVLEKLPLFVLAAASAAVTVVAQRAGGAVGSLESLPVMERVLAAGAGVVAYLGATVWPSGLAVFYPHPALVGRDVSLLGLAGIALVLAGLAVAWRTRRSAPALGVGWCWFLGMLVPVLGLVQVGDQAWADRYAYLPTIGLYVALAFPLADALRARRTLLAPAAAAAGLAVLALAWRTTQELEPWRDSRTLFERALAVTRDNWVAHNNLGLVYLERRDLARAEEHFAAATRLRPSFVEAHYNLGLTHEATSDFEHAVQDYDAALAVRDGHAPSLLRLASLARASNLKEEANSIYDHAVETNPRDASVFLAFARALLEDGEVDRAENCAASALALEPDLPAARFLKAEIALRRGEVDAAGEALRAGLARAPDDPQGQALLGRWRVQTGDLAGARAALERAIALEPGLARARYDLGTVLLNQKEREAARVQFQTVLDVNPGDAQALTALAVMQIEEQHLDEAIALLERALVSLPGFPHALVNLGVAREQKGQWKEAIEAYQQSFAGGAPTPDVARALSWILATCPDEALCDGKRARELADYAVKRGDVRAIEVLAAACARAGDFETAVKLQQQLAERAAPEQKIEAQARLALYQAQRPYTRPR